MDFLSEYLHTPFNVTLKERVQQDLWLVQVKDKGTGLALLPCIDHLLHSDDSLVLWNVKYSESNGLVRIEADFKDASRFMIQQNDAVAPARFAEICSGLGGWSHGLHSFDYKPVAMVELNPVTAALAAQMFGMESRFIGDLWKELVGGTNPTPCVIVGSADDPRTWGVLSTWKVNFLVASPPCPPWSSIGTDGGLGSQDGQLMPTIIYYAAHMKVRALALENVPGFPKHSHFRPLLTLAALLKMPLIQGGCLDCYPASPLMRNRWLGTFASPEHKPDNDVMARLQNFVMVPSTTTAPSIRSDGCAHVNITDEELKELAISAEARKVLDDPSLCPANFSQNRAQSIMQARTKTFEHSMTGLVASYGSQHEIPMHHLQQKGLYTTILSDDQDRLRYYSPWEMVACLGWPETTILPTDLKRAMTICGNALSSLRALAQLHRMDVILGDMSPFQSTSWECRIGKLRQSMLSLQNFKQECDDRSRYLVRVQNLPAVLPVQAPPDEVQLAMVEEPKAPTEVILGVLNGNHHHGLSQSVVSLVEPKDSNHFDFEGIETEECFIPCSAMVDPYLDFSCDDVLVDAPNSGCHVEVFHDEGCPVNGHNPYGANTPKRCNQVQAVKEVHNFIGSLVGNINGFLEASSHKVCIPSEGLSDGCVVGSKRVLHVDDTWGIGIHDRFTSFLTHANDQVLVTSSHHTFMDFSHLEEILQQQVQQSELGKAWTGARPVLFHASRNHWMRIAFVPDRLSTLSILRCILPHAKHDHFVKVLVNGSSVVPSSIPPGFGKLIFDFLTIPLCGKIMGPDDQPLQYNFDVTTTVADLISFIAGKVSIHQRSIKLFHGMQPIKPDAFLSVLPMTQLSWKCHCDIQLLSLPAIHPTTEQVHIPPVHSDVATTIPGPLLRLAIRHPVWGSIKTVGCGQDCMVGTAMEMLFPDLINSFEIGVSLDGNAIPAHTTFASLVAIPALEVSFDGTNPLPVATMEIIVGIDVVEQASLGKLTASRDSLPVRWVRSPFDARASEKQFSAGLSLVRLAGLYLSHCAASQVILALVDGKHVDPRVLFDATDPRSVISFRTCCLPGGAKNDDVISMVTKQLSIRGVQPSDLESRVTTVIEKLGADKLRTHLNDLQDKQWAAIKNLANLAKTRLITPQELQQFQKKKKASKETFGSDSESTAAASSSSTGTGAKPKPRPAHDFSTIKLDLSHFQSPDGSVELFCADDFGRHQCGVTIMHTTEALKYTPLSQISEDPLAILAVGTTPILGLPIHLAPAKSAKDEPILVPVTILNFGATKIMFEAGHVNAKVQVHESYTVEFWLRRALTKNWEQAKSPMAVLGGCVPELAQGALLAHWAVKFFDKDRKATSHDKADYVHGFLKILSTKVDPVLARSGCNGFFAIPKNCAHKPHEDFAILHMPSMKLAELLAQTQKVPNTLGVIETSSGYAVRCRRQHWNAIRKSLMPDSPLPDEGEFAPGDSMYSLRKLNIATTPADLTKALVDLGWTSAKAIRPIGAQGWCIAAASPPPSWHLCLNDSFVIVTSNERYAKNNALTAVTIPANATMEPDRPKPTDTPVPQVSKLVDLKSELHKEIQTIVDSKMRATNDQIVHLQQSMHRTEGDIQVMKKAQLNTESKITEVEATISASNTSLLTQMSGMFQQLQSTLTERLDKMEVGHEGQECKRPRTVS